MDNELELKKLKLMKMFANTMMIATAILAIIVVASALLSWLTPHDDTDPPGGRSGMSLLIDHKTGCQYLYRRGAITPRMNADGKQICETHQ